MQPISPAVAEPTTSATRIAWWLPVTALLVCLALYVGSVFLPVWETRSDHSGEWDVIPGFLPLMIGFLGLLVLCPAWFANLLLIPLCITLFKGRRAGFFISLVALALAATAYYLPAIYGDNEAAIIIHRKIGFYLWLASFLILALSHALLIDRTQAPPPLARGVLLAVVILLIISLQLAFPVGVTPLEEALKDPNNLQPLVDRLAANPSQAEKDAAFQWAFMADFSKYINGGGSRRVEKLLASGANVDQPNRYGTTPLMRAVNTRGSDTLVDLLVHAGADVNAHDSAGKSILAIAREAGASPHVIETLTAAGAH